MSEGQAQQRQGLQARALRLTLDRTMSDPVRYVLDLNALPPLTEAQKVELHALSQMPDSDIDCSDIPPLDETFWQNAVANPFLLPD